MYWVALSRVPGVGPKRFDDLMTVLAQNRVSLKELWSFSKKEVLELHFSQFILENLAKFKEGFDLEKTSKELESKGIQIATYDDDTYPELLKQIPDKPPVLYVKGNLVSRIVKPLAVVGTRKVTSYGHMITQKLTRDLVTHNFTVISGFMYGVDAIAHRTTIEQKGYTIGVLGFGFDDMYPVTHKKLFEQVLDSGGAFISEYIPETLAIPGNFPMRNRIVAGMSLGVLVTEAAVNSGSKITAQCAVEYGREVFAVPGPMTSRFSEGTKELMNQGAKLVTCVEDIIEEFSPLTIIPQQLSIELLDHFTHPIEKQIIEQLLVGEMEVDELAQSIHESVSNVMSALSLLEIGGYVVQNKGKYIVSL